MKDWATAEAEKHLPYLFMCQRHEERIELLASVFRMIESQGACRAAGEAQQIITAAFETRGAA